MTTSDGSKLTSEDFEELVFWLLHREGFFSLTWLETSKGRDIVCQRTELLGSRVVTHDCFVRCQAGGPGLEPEDLRKALTETSERGFEFLVLATTAAIDEPTRDWAAHTAGEAGSHVVIWESSDLDNLLEKHQDLRFKFLATPLSAEFFLHQLSDERSQTAHSMTPAVEAVLTESCTIALEDDQSVTLAHLFLLLLKLDIDCTCQLIAELGGDLSIVRENLISIIMEQPEATAHEYGLIVSTSVRDAISTAVHLSDDFSHGEITERVLLLAMTSLEESYSIQATLRSVNIDFSAFTQKLLAEYLTPSEADSFASFRKKQLAARRTTPRAFRTFDTTQIGVQGVLRQLEPLKQPPLKS
jgi:hypothetical protein